MSGVDGGPAFPSEYTERDKFGHPHIHYAKGMSLRDYFAGQALASIVDGRWQHCEAYAEAAYRYADAMLAARNAETSG